MRRLLLLFLIPFFSAFSSKEKPCVTVTTAAHAKLVKELAGPDFEVLTFVPADKNACHYHPLSSDILKHEKSQLWLGTGVPIEKRLKSQERFVSLLGEGARGRHTHLDPIALKEQMARAEKALAELKPEAAARLSARRTALDKRLDELDAWVKDYLKKHPVKAALTFKPIIDSFCARYGIELITVKAGCSKGVTEASLKKVATRTAALGMQHLISEPDELAAEKAASHLGVDIAILNAYGDNVFEVIKNVAKQVATEQ